MERIKSLQLICGFLVLWSSAIVNADDPYKFFDWTVTYGTASPLGVPQQVILINGQFPGPTIDCVTNDNLIINVINNLDEPFLLTWQNRNGVKQRKNSWQDGVLGTNCPIPPNSNYTYSLQVKDQIGTYTYFPSIGMQRASGGFGSIMINNRNVIALPYRVPDGDFSLLVGDWYSADHKALSQVLDSGKFLPPPDGILMNGQTHTALNGDSGKTYRIRVANVGLKTSINFRIEGHKLVVVEVEGSHVIQNIYDSIDVHPGQAIASLVTFDQPPNDYNIIAFTRFTDQIQTVSGVLHYSNSIGPAGPVSPPPALPEQWSLDQARSFRWNLSANAARPNIQGSFHYGQVTVTKAILLENSSPIIDGRQRCAVNGVSYINPDTPLKLADHFSIPGVFTLNSIPGSPTEAPAKLGTSVLDTSFHDFAEIIFQNSESTLQSWHLDGYDFWVVGFGFGKWTEANRQSYNLHDAFTRYTTQVYPNSWTAILVSLDNKGMWNLRSAIWERRYLGQELYIRVWNEQQSLTSEYNIPHNALMCGRAAAFIP
ncbi:hypothetical protein V2J09_021771 [Rumex salicifolius]